MGCCFICHADFKTAEEQINPTPIIHKEGDYCCGTCDIKFVAPLRYRQQAVYTTFTDGDNTVSVRVLDDTHKFLLVDHLFLDGSPIKDVNESFRFTLPDGWHWMTDDKVLFGFYCDDTVAESQIPIISRAFIGLLKTNLLGTGGGAELKMDINSDVVQHVKKNAREMFELENVKRLKQGINQLKINYINLLILLFIL